MNSEINDYLIVGSGLTGLSLAWDLQHDYPDLKIKLVEKSKSCGGRMATRRIENIKFDHGAQFLKLSNISEKWISLWEGQGIASKFPSESFDAICADSGITQLAKFLAKDLEITYNYKASTLSKQSSDPSNTIWELSDTEGLKIFARNIILTCPLPQSLALLDNSRITYDSGLTNLPYSSAIVVLAESDENFDPNLVYNEDLGGDLFSICAQHAEGNSETPAWTIVMDAEWSQKNFDLSDEELLKKACEKIQAHFPNLKIKSSNLKKWKYCQPLETWKWLFESPKPNLYLAGDAFGGPSLQGALKSSTDLLNHLKTNIF